MLERCDYSVDPKFNHESKSPIPGLVVVPVIQIPLLDHDLCLEANYCIPLQ